MGLDEVVGVGAKREQREEITSTSNPSQSNSIDRSIEGVIWFESAKLPGQGTRTAKSPNPRSRAGPAVPFDPPSKQHIAITSVPHSQKSATHASQRTQRRPAASAPARALSRFSSRTSSSRVAAGFFSRSNDSIRCSNGFNSRGLVLRCLRRGNGDVFGFAARAPPLGFSPQYSAPRHSIRSELFILTRGIA